MRTPARLVLAGLLGLLCSLLVACGSSGKLFPAGDASSLDSSLDQVAGAVASGNCRQAMKAVDDAQQRAQALPASVDPRLRSKLESGLSNLANRAAQQCQPTVTKPQTTTTQTTTTKSTPTTTTQTQTTSTQTTPTQTTTTTTTPTQTTTTSTTPAPNGGTPAPPGPPGATGGTG